MRTRSLFTIFAIAAAALAPAGAHAQDSHTHDRRSGRHAAWVVRQATHGYRDVTVAEADGYGQFMTCVREPGMGAMGTHWVNGELVGDTVLDARRPEAIMYETKPSGRLKLIGVEYLVFQEAWDAEHDRPPELFGHEFHLTGTPNRYGLPPFYALHVWAWRNNPAGVFANWNPRVTCDHAAGVPI